MGEMNCNIEEEVATVEGSEEKIKEWLGPIKEKCQATFSLVRKENGEISIVFIGPKNNIQEVINEFYYKKRSLDGRITKLGLKS